MLDDIAEIHELMADGQLQTLAGAAVLLRRALAAIEARDCHSPWLEPRARAAGEAAGGGGVKGGEASPGGPDLKAGTSADLPGTHVLPKTIDRVCRDR